jgi:hypothetical protein
MPSKPNLRVFLFGLSVFLPCYSFSQDPPLPPTIGKIVIQANDIFDPTVPSESLWPYRAVNFLHIQTRRSVIRRELLFKEGDIYNRDLIEETERNLRRFSFLRHVHIIEVPGGNNTIDLEVRTSDTWTLEPQANFNRIGGKNNTKIGIVERNLLGTGNKVSLMYEDGENDNHRTFIYRNQQFLSRLLTLEVKDVNGPDLRQYGGTLSKPFRSTKSKDSFGISSTFTQEDIAVYSKGTEVGKFERKNRESFIEYGHSLKRSTALIRRALFSFLQQSREYAVIGGDTMGLIKPDLELSVLSMGFQWEKQDFIKEQHINKFDRDEDFNLGPGAALRFGVGQNWEENKRIEGLPQAEAQTGIGWRKGHFSLIRMSYKSRISNDTSDDLLWTTNIQSYHRLHPKNTLAFNMAYDHGHKLDPEDYLLLGEDVGLRGYPIGRFSGDKRFLLNLEDRLFFVDDWLHLFSLGGTAFYDAGYAWKPEDTMGITDLRHAVGIGFRIALSRSSRNEPIRIDLAYALNNNDKSNEDKNERLVISIRSGVRFGDNVSQSTRQVNQ